MGASGDVAQRMAFSRSVVAGAVDGIAASIAALTSSHLVLEELPIAGAVLTRAQIEDLAARDDVESIYLDEPLKYFNYEAGRMTGGHFVHDEYGARVAEQGYGFLAATAAAGYALVAVLYTISLKGVLPLERAPRKDALAPRGNPPVPSKASSRGRAPRRSAATDRRPPPRSPTSRAASAPSRLPRS